MKFSLDGAAASGMETAPDRFKLASLSVEIDGVLKKYFEGETIYVTPDQKIKIAGASLMSKFRPSYINMVGLTHNLPERNTLDDTGIEFESKDLLSVWALDEHSQVFKIDVRKKRYLSGQVFLKVMKPRIEYVELFVNGKSRIVRDQDILTFRSTDKFRVGKIKLNLPSTKNITYKVIKMEKQGRLAASIKTQGGYEYYELLFLYDKKPLITFPMRIK